LTATGPFSKVEGMSDATRLGRSTLPAGYRTASPAGVPGIVHLGLGNFHRAHQGVYTARALEVEPGPWGTSAFSNRSESVVEAMRAQDLLYAVLQISPQGCSVSVPGVHVRVDVAAADPAAVIAAIAAPSTRIVTLTVTEHGYTYSPTTHDLDLSAPAVQRDLARPEHPLTSVGQVAAGLVQRFVSGGEPVSVVSCDNLGGNGSLLRRLVTSFVTHGSLAPSQEFLAWLGDHVSFPNTMVDRIVPATSPAHRALAADLLGVHDAVPVPAEPFSMWVLQDDFAAGRPAWERAGAIFSDDVEAYELLKLRLLNGTHSLIAYLGVLAGAATIAEAVAVPYVEAAARALMRDEYLPTVRVPGGVDVDRYVAELFHRFSNTELAHRTSQVGSDGSQKLPQRVSGPALHHLQHGDVPQLICLTVAAFLACVAPRDGHRGDLADDIRDPMLPALRRLAAEAPSARALVDSVFDGTSLLPPDLTGVALFRGRVAELLDALERHGPQAAVRGALG
jgi:fructuronate reductase